MGRITAEAEMLHPQVASTSKIRGLGRQLLRVRSSCRLLVACFVRRAGKRKSTLPSAGVFRKSKEHVLFLCFTSVSPYKERAPRPILAYAFLTREVGASLGAAAVSRNVVRGGEGEGSDQNPIGLFHLRRLL